MRKPNASFPPAAHPSPRSADSRPRTVLQSIGAEQGRGVAQAPASEHHRGDARPAISGPRLRLMQPSDAGKLPHDQDDVLESARQIQQLAQRLSEQRHRLQQQAQDLEQQQSLLLDQRREVDVELDRQFRQLRQQESFARRQQQQLMQLQSEIVSSYEAIKIAVESLVSRESIDPSTVSDLQRLQHELGPRFDYISRRWERLYAQLENQRVQRDAEQAIDDAVHWDR